MVFSLQNKVFKICFLVITLLVVGSCAKKQLTTLHLKDGEMLLAKNKLKLTNKVDFDSEELTAYIRQKPNKSFLFGTWKLRLQWKNICYNPNSGNKRPAVILDSNLVDRSARQMEILLKNKGYYNTNIATKITPIYWLGVKKWPTKKAKVTYTVSANSPMKIDSVQIDITQPNILKFYNAEKQNSKVKKGNILRIEDLEEERTRITTALNDKGFYDFGENYIRFNVDSSRGIDSVIIVTKIKQPARDSLHQQFTINNVYVNTTYDPYAPNNIATDTVEYDGIKFISTGKSTFNPGPISRSIFIYKNDLFSQRNQSLTFRQLANLQVFSFIKIEFKEARDSSGKKVLNTFILLQPAKRMSLSAELMGTFREGFGANGQVAFTRKNAFGNSEILNFSITAGIENLKQLDEDDFKIGSNIGPRLSLSFPGLFLLPKLTKSIRKNAFPKTTLSAYYNFQRRPRFTRYLTNLSLTYQWNEGPYKKHELSIPDISFSFITKDSRILEELSNSNPAQKFRFEDAISAGLKYQFTYNNQQKPKVKNPIYLTANGWLVGPTAVLANVFSFEDRDVETNAITLANIRYATFVKAQGDLRKYYNFSKKQQIALRGFLGFGIPLDKDGVIPFDQLYFGGGANSVRGWRQRQLGPGGYFDPDDNVDRLGEIKIEASVEYRFPITNIFKGALFLDAGNVWAEENREGDNDLNQYFEFDRFYKQIAVSPGVGIRLDFDFFLFRLDLGVPLKQAYQPDFWKLDFQETQLNFGVGYPF